ncbi:MAG: glycoside hydrolase family 44 protein [bacterium]
MAPGALALPLILLWAALAQAAPASSATPVAEPAVVRIEVDASQGRRPISPWLYGRNMNLAGLDQTMFRPARELALEAGLRISRESDGNNGTKYNWRNDLSSHPDWYNNVYKQNRPERARVIQDTCPGVVGLFSLPVLGWVAKTDRANCNENKLDPGHKNPHANLCGGGVATAYLESQTPKEIVDVLDRWFGPRGPVLGQRSALSATEGLGLDPKRFPVWHLDNEPECWRGSHDDVSGTLMTGEECVRMYVAVACEVKTRYPDAKLMAPGFSSEWFWWNWSDHNCVGGLPWMEYFIKRMAEESKAFGRPLIDLVDIHTYTNENGTDDAILQEHRTWYDPGYASPSANGCKRVPDCGWHDDQKVEMVLGRIEGWLDRYFGPGHGLGIATTESGAHSKTPMVRALWYASHLGVFSDHGVQVFPPWFWPDAHRLVVRRRRHGLGLFVPRPRHQRRHDHPRLPRQVTAAGRGGAQGPAAIHREGPHPHPREPSRQADLLLPYAQRAQAGERQGP